MNNLPGFLIGVGFCVWTLIVFVIGMVVGYKAFSENKNEKKVRKKNEKK